MLRSDEHWNPEYDVMVLLWMRIRCMVRTTQHLSRCCAYQNFRGFLKHLWDISDSTQNVSKPSTVQCLQSQVTGRTTTNIVTV